MKLKLKEEPGEWRKAAWMSLLGLALLSSVLRWRRILPIPAWIAILCILVMLAVTAGFQPRWFRGYYRFSARMGFALSQFAGCVVLVLFFVFVITPLGLAMRILGKDPLRLRRPASGETYWSEIGRKSSLDRLF